MRKTILYAPRLKGDLDLGLEPSRVRGTVKDWARMDFPGGLVLGGSEQEIYEESAGTTANYRIGTRRVQDERTFHYMRADATYGVTAPFWSCADTRKYKVDDSEDTIEGVTVGTGVAADLTLTTLDGGDHTVDFFEGGWAVLTVVSIIRMLRIRSSTATATAPAGSVTLTLWDPLGMAVPEGSQLQVFPSRYSAVASSHPGSGWNDGKSVKVCMPIMPVTPLHYFWGQTWGPCYGIPSEAFPRGQYEMDLVFSGDGSIKLRPLHSANNINQHAGYRLSYYVDDPTGVLILFQLEIAP